MKISDMGAVFASHFSWEERQTFLHVAYNAARLEVILAFFLYAHIFLSFLCTCAPFPALFLHLVLYNLSNVIIYILVVTSVVAMMSLSLFQKISHWAFSSDWEIGSNLGEPNLLNRVDIWWIRSLSLLCNNMADFTPLHCTYTPLSFLH